ncbi:MAG: DinB family protein [Opitutus sp.]|nr:DinB family protein [Opitutus sp.]
MSHRSSCSADLPQAHLRIHTIRPSPRLQSPSLSPPPIHPMKRLLLALCLAPLLSPWLNAAALTAEELTRATDHLKKTSTAFLASTKGLSEAQLNFKPDPTRWSVAEVAEHIASAEDFLMGMIQEKVMKAPARTEPANLKEIDDFVVTAIADRSKKAQAPEPLAPTNRFGSAAGSVKHFKESRAKTVAFLKDTKDLREHASVSQLGKTLDAYQWVLFVSAHCERHTKQIDEVKADPNFPKK